MKETVNTSLLARDKFMSEMHLKQDLLIVHADYLLKIKNGFRNLKKQEIRVIFTKMNFTRHAFNMI